MKSVKTAAVCDVYVVCVCLCMGLFIPIQPLRYGLLVLLILFCVLRDWPFGVGMTSPISKETYGPMGYAQLPSWDRRSFQLVLFGGLVATGLFITSFFTGRSEFDWLKPGYLGFVFVQAFLLYPVLMRRLVAIYPDQPALARMVASLVFGLAHIPNPVLMVTCFLVALFWTGAYLEKREVWSLVASQFLLARSLEAFVPDWFVMGMRVGAGAISRWPVFVGHWLSIFGWG